VVATAAACLAGSVFFFVVTNFGVWALGTLYPKTGAGLASCYAAAVPYFRNTVLGDAAFTAVLFSGLWAVEWAFPRLRAQGVAPA
jgi:hypothetical protein